MKQLSVSRLAGGCLVMLSSLSSAENVAERERGGQLRWQLWSSLHCPWWKREQPELKDVGVMFAMKEYCVVTTPHWAFHPSTAGRPSPPQNDFTIWWSRFLIWKVCTDWSLLPWLMVTGDQLSQLSTGLWSQGRDVRIAITMRRSVTLPLMDVATLMMELLMTLSSGCTVVAGGWAGPRWLCFTDLQVSWDSEQPSLHLFSGLVIRHCPSSPLLLFRLGLNHRLRFPVKNQLNNLPIGIG